MSSPSVMGVRFGRDVVDAAALAGLSALLAGFVLGPFLRLLAVPAALAAVTVVLVVLSVGDLQTHRLPNRATVGLAVAAIGTAAGLYGAGQAWRLGPCLAGLAMFAVIGFAEALHPEGIGGGDAKLLAAVGGWTGLLGWGALVPVLLATHLVMIAILAVGRFRSSGRRVVMGPAISAGVVLGWLLTGLLL